MALSDLGGILKIFGGSEPSPEEQAELAKELMLMVLARATSADSNIKAVEIETVQQVLARHGQPDVPAADIRVAASSSIYEDAPLDRYVASTSRKLPTDARTEVAVALTEIIKSDDIVGDREIEFFDAVVGALDLSPSQIAGLGVS